MAEPTTLDRQTGLTPLLFYAERLCQVDRPGQSSGYSRSPTDFGQRRSSGWLKIR